MTTPHTEDHKPTPSQSPIDPNKLFLPGAILLAGVMISGTILYTSHTANISNVGAQQQQPTAVDASQKISVSNLIKWAKDIKLDSSKFEECLDAARYTAEIKKDAADGVTAGVSGTPAFFINGRKIVGAMPFSTFKTMIDEELKGVKTTDERVAISNDDDPVLGDANAAVTMVEFSDYECPFCKRFYDDTLAQIKSTYIDTGKLKLVYRDYPLSFHPGAEPAAQAANCAGEQGKYWEMHDKIFEAQG